MNLIKRLQTQQEVYDGTYVQLPHSFVNEIVKALQAAQAMIENIKLGTTVSGSTQLVYIPVEKSDKVLEALKQWDAASRMEGGE